MRVLRRQRHDPRLALDERHFAEPPRVKGCSLGVSAHAARANGENHRRKTRKLRPEYALLGYTLGYEVAQRVAQRLIIVAIPRQVSDRPAKVDSQPRRPRVPR